jgi:hypothetical protein
VSTATRAVMEVFIVRFLMGKVGVDTSKGRVTTRKFG